MTMNNIIDNQYLRLELTEREREMEGEREREEEVRQNDESHDRSLV